MRRSCFNSEQSFRILLRRPGNISRFCGVMTSELRKRFQPRENVMKAWIGGAVLGVALVGVALPASALVVVRSGGERVVVREGYRHHYDRGHHYGWRNRYASCRTVTVRRHRPNGTVVVTR